MKLKVGDLKENTNRVIEEVMDEVHVLKRSYFINCTNAVPKIDVT